uniref:Uncharacterized protein n=1 Tax=Amphimedon queenslandica TaxID=400682 RepID=A0A1X7THI4_AMPQE
MTLIPWEKGKPLVCDAMVPDSLVVFYRSKAIAATGTVAASAESRKSPSIPIFPSLSYFVLWLLSHLECWVLDLVILFTTLVVGFGISWERKIAQASYSRGCL